MVVLQVPMALMRWAAEVEEQKAHANFQTRFLQPALLSRRQQPVRHLAAGELTLEELVAVVDQKPEALEQSSMAEEEEQTEEQDWQKKAGVEEREQRAS